MNTTGAVSSATAYQRGSTLHRSNRESNLRRPARPETRAVNRSPAMLGPASIATTKNGSRGSDCHVVPDIPSSPPTASRPPHEIANVSAKYVGTGCLATKTLSRLMTQSSLTQPAVVEET